MNASLKRVYYILLAPAICGFFLVFAAEQLDILAPAGPLYPTILAPLVFTLSVLFAAALPIFWRTLFANKMRNRKHITESEWLGFERTILYLAMVSPYLALAAHLLQLPRFHYAGTVIMALYALYYYYPSKKRLAFDRRLFRVK